MFGTVETNGGGDTSEDEEDERPDRGDGIDSGVDLANGSGASLEEYGGNDLDIVGSGIIEPLPLDQVNNIQGLYNEINHHYSCPTPHSLHKKPVGQHSHSHSATELPALALQQQ